MEQAYRPMVFLLIGIVIGFSIAAITYAVVTKVLSFVFMMFLAGTGTGFVASKFFDKMVKKKGVGNNVNMSKLP